MTTPHDKALAAAKKLCSIHGCDKIVSALGLCRMHYVRKQRHGDPLFLKRTPPGTLMRFIREVAVPFQGDECLEWPFSRSYNGYGQLPIGNTSMKAHRYVCIIAHGDPPDPSLEAAHSCGNGHLGCVNPKHLRWATHTENVADQMLHGRIRRGASHPLSKVTLDEVKEIKTLLVAGISQADIARKFGVNHGIVNNIKAGRTWKWA